MDGLTIYSKWFINWMIWVFPIFPYFEKPPIIYVNGAQAGIDTVWGCSCICQYIWKIWFMNVPRMYGYVHMQSFFYILYIHRRLIINATNNSTMLHTTDMRRNPFTVVSCCRRLVPSPQNLCVNWCKRCPRLWHIFAWIFVHVITFPMQLGPGMAWLQQCRPINLPLRCTQATGWHH